MGANYHHQRNSRIKKIRTRRNFTASDSVVYGIFNWNTVKRISLLQRIPEKSNKREKKTQIAYCQKKKDEEKIRMLSGNKKIQVDQVDHLTLLFEKIK